MNERAVANAQRIKGQNASNALSVFDDINIYRQTLEMASGLSRSFIVPKDFQNKPESCLIALDLARRLGVHVMTLFPHLYVVDSKPAFSTQFLISLVNSSGVFTRIEWDEGYDGEAEVTYSEWGDQRGSKNVWKETVPNYFAIARFQELSTGKTFESPRVDLRFAEQNGWTTKPGSKWRSMPQIMCAYRSASILIKRVCPEITLGLDFAEDLRDAAPIEAQFVARGSSTVGMEPAPVPAISSEVCDEDDDALDYVGAYLSKIDTAETAEALALVGHEIKAARTWNALIEVANGGPTLSGYPEIIRRKY